MIIAEPRKIIVFFYLLLWQSEILFLPNLHMAILQQ